MQIIIQNYNDNLHEHQNQTKYYHYILYINCQYLVPTVTKDEPCLQ